MKASKEEVHYRGGHDGVECRNCTMYRHPGECTAVQGYIRPTDVCDLFEKRKSHIAQMVGRAVRKGMPQPT